MSELRPVPYKMEILDLPPTEAYRLRPKTVFVDGAWPRDPARVAQDLIDGALSPETVLSDHLPLISKETEVGRVLTFNVLTRCETTEERTNNGFGTNETQAAYEARLERLARRLGELTATSVNVVALQEVPKEKPDLLKRLFAHLPQEEWSIYTQASGRSPFAQALALRRARFPRVEVVGVEGLNAHAQAGRIQTIRAEPINAEPVLFANLHLSWPDPAVAELEGLLQLPRMIAAGDFNRRFDHPLRKLDDLALKYPAEVIFPHTPTCIAFRPGPNPALRSIDGFVFRGITSAG